MDKIIFCPLKILFASVILFVATICFKYFSASTLFHLVAFKAIFDKVSPALIEYSCCTSTCCCTTSCVPFQFFLAVLTFSYSSIKGLKVLLTVFPTTFVTAVVTSSAF
ncbi:MAG: hypothetical protein LBQ24_06885 [Candidatus Peribacteria bacterium]|nr:hypothetical protein [Candidatus Peribacteria bacterium]